MVDSSAYISKIIDLKQDIKKSLDFINWKDNVKSDSTVFIKPNFTFPYYKEGVTTSPELIKYLMEILDNRADKVILGESDGGNHSFKSEDAFDGHNMQNICKETGVELLNLSKSSRRMVQEEIEGKNVKVPLPEILLDEVDCFISVPVLKVHVMTGVSLSIKNLWGCHPDTMRCLEHKNLSEKLTLMAKNLNPQICVVDGMFALDGHGPMYGTAKKTDLIISANNPVVTDALGASIMGMRVSEIDHIQVAEKEGLGSSDLENVTLNCDWKKYEMDFHIKKTLTDRISVIFFKSEVISRLAMDSYLTPFIYKCHSIFKTTDERELSSEMKNYKKYTK